MAPDAVGALSENGNSANLDLLIQLNSCDKVFIQRDYSKGLAVKFDRLLPDALRNMISEALWLEIMDEVNEVFAAAEKISRRSALETILGCVTCGASRLASRSHYEKQMDRLSILLERRNREQLVPLGLYMAHPIDRGLRVIEVSLLTTYKRSAASAVPEAAAAAIHSIRR